MLPDEVLHAGLLLVLVLAALEALSRLRAGLAWIGRRVRKPAIGVGDRHQCHFVPTAKETYRGTPRTLYVCADCGARCWYDD